MKPKELRQMSQLTEALYRVERRKIDEILKRESRIIAALRQIDANNQGHPESQSDPQNPFFVSGANAVWQVWAERRKSELARELNDLRQVKHRLLSDSRIAFGRYQAIESLEKLSH